MKIETENAIRSIINMDPTVDKGCLERAIHILKACPEDDEDIPHVLRCKDALKILKIHRRTLDYYIKRGYIQRVYGSGRVRALGVSRESVLAFMRVGLEGPRKN